MKNKNDWKPELYLKYKNERTQPSIDLVNRININYDPENIIDFGCGPGNSSQVLIEKWPSCKLTGVDASESMIEKAREDYPNQEWIDTDAAVYESEIKFDIVFSNAAIQWIPNHKDLLNKFYGLLSGRGALAVQVPLFWDMPIGRAIKSVARCNRWKDKTGAVENLFTIHDHFFYYNLLSSLFEHVEIWETDYYHIMDSHSSILEMIRSTGLKPYFEKLGNDHDKIEFENEVLEIIKQDYQLHENGKVLFPFQRLFFTGYK